MASIETIHSLVVVRDVLPDFAHAFPRRGVARVLREGEYLFPNRADLGTVFSSGKVFLVKRGSLTVMLNEQGSIRALGTVQQGAVLADLAEKAFPGMLRAEQETEIIVIARKDFEDLLMQYPALSVRLVRILASQLHKSEEKLAEAVTGDATSRILRELVQKETVMQADGSLKIPYVTHEYLAKRVGLARETVTRTLAKLIEVGKLERLPGRVGYILRSKLL